jgi:hypothetical protein
MATVNRVFFGNNLSFTAASNDLEVIGASGGNEKLLIQSGVTGLKLDANIERVELAGNLANFKFIIIESIGLQIQNSAGVVVSTISSLNQDSTIAFSDGSAVMVQTGGSSFTLGGTAISTTTASAVNAQLNAADPSTVSTSGGNTISAGGSSDASTADKLYTFAAGTYTYNISGFGTGDVLDFPAGSDASINNESYTDGVIDLTWASAGSTVAIHLTGIAAANDVRLNSVADFGTVFGNGTII